MNKFKLNERKTKIMEVNLNSDEVYKMKVEHIKYPGFII